jgi:hypothetical protein
VFHLCSSVALFRLPSSASLWQTALPPWLFPSSARGASGETFPASSVLQYQGLANGGGHPRGSHRLDGVAFESRQTGTHSLEAIVSEWAKQRVGHSEAAIAQAPESAHRKPDQGCEDDAWPAEFPILFAASRKAAERYFREGAARRPSTQNPWNCNPLSPFRKLVAVRSCLGFALSGQLVTLAAFSRRVGSGSPGGDSRRLGQRAMHFEVAGCDGVQILRIE